MVKKQAYDQNSEQKDEERQENTQTDAFPYIPLGNGYHNVYVNGSYRLTGQNPPGVSKTGLGRYVRLIAGSEQSAIGTI
jgi:hypothetical protein